MRVEAGEAAAQRRAEASAPIVAAAHRATRRAACSTACRIRSTSAASCAPRPRSAWSTCTSARTRPRPRTRRSGKTALGTQRYVEWTQYERVGDAADAARADGFAIVGLELADESVPFFELDLTGDVCIALGNESNGLNDGALACCDAVGYIPQLGRVGSLNVAAATAVALYEARRQGWQAS